jgi:serine/threonine-protein kinase
MVGRTIGRYEIVEQLGAGGMGVVYRARDTSLNRFVALKFLAGHLLNSESARTRFYHEARVISALSHPNIAVIYEIGDEAGEPFLALEYLSGGTLHSRLEAAGGSLNTAEALRTAEALFDGLGHAHRNGILHRDIKPANLMYNAEGLMKITDFGLAKLIDGPSHTRADTRVGTLMYMSPEQAEGGALDARSDLFSAGIVAYEMLTGVSAFRAPTEAATLLKIVQATPEPLENLRPDLSPRIRGMVMRLLEKDPARRYQRAEDVLLDIRIAERESDAHPTVSFAAPLPRRGAPTSRRRMLAWGIPACVAAALVGVAVIPRARRYAFSFFPAGVPAQKRIAVMPLAHIEDDPAQRASNEAFCEGLTENLTSALSRLRQFQQTLLVVPFSEVLRLKEGGVAAVRQAFGVNLVVTGGVQRMSNPIRLTLNLVDANTGFTLPGRSVSRSYRDIEELQNGVEAELVSLLGLELQPEARTALAANRTSVPGAYEAYTEANGLLQRPDKEGNLDRAIALFEKATKLDDRYALAWAGLSDAWFRRYEDTKDPQWLTHAQQSASRAVELNSQLPRGYISQGQIYRATGHYEQAVEAFQTALRIDPVNAPAFRGLGAAWEQLGRRQDAEATYRQAVRLSPDDWFAVNDLAAFFFHTGQLENAAGQFRRATEIAPDNYKAWNNLGGVYYDLGRYGEARQAFQKSIAIHPSGSAYSNLGSVLQAAGQYLQATAMFEKALQLKNSDYRVAANLADCYRLTPEYRNRAPQQYQKAIDMAEAMLLTNPRDAVTRSRVGVYRARLGQTEEALGDIAAAQRLAPANPDVQYSAALANALAGRPDKAVDALQAALRCGYQADLVRRDPDLAELRTNPRLKKLLP